MSFFHCVTVHAFDRRTDRQTDRQTDGRTDSFLVARPRLHCIQRGKNRWAIKSGNGHKNLWDPSEKVRETTVGRIYGKGKFWVRSGTEMKWCIVKSVRPSVRPSVCPSVILSHSWSTPKRFNISRCIAFCTVRYDRAMLDARSLCGSWASCICVLQTICFMFAA